DRERETELHHILFEVLDGEGEKHRIPIATTRPELLPSCVGVFVHPNDQRFRNLVGKTAIVPIFNHRVPIMADERVDPGFGSGIVMVCTFGDTTDIEWWKTYKLQLAISITPDGCLNSRAGKYEGLTIPEARKKIVGDLKDKGLLVGSERLTQTVGCCWRCGTPLEYIVTPQWFIKTLEHKEALIEQGKKIRWYPPYYRKRFEDWVRNLSWDWVISRQRYYGVPIPVWYCKRCGREILASEEQLPVDPTVDKPPKPCRCGSTEFKPDEDVFDTWMTSSMTPQIACKWLEDPELYKRLFPMSLRPQSHDIIRTWAFYTILKSYLHFGSIPWKEIMIGTYVLDPQGRGMHKSKGNAIWLEDLLKKYNVDAIRYWVGTASVGEDLPFKEKEIRRGTRVLTKLWNASRFLGLNLDSKPEEPAKLELVDRWILSKLAATTKEYKSFFMRYEISKARKALEMFFMHDFADNYLEMIKYRIYGGDGESRDAALWTLYQVLLGVVKLFAPFIPHLTEEIYQSIFKPYEKVESIHLTTFPEEGRQDQEAEKLGELGKEIVAAVRQHKTRKRMSLGEKLGHLTISHPKPGEVEKLREMIMGTLRIERLDILQGPFSVSD
ncbi:MAG: valine--tRNA ligase, partial [Methanobacteriota archaeon]